jgi:hypothetical protein
MDDIGTSDTKHTRRAGAASASWLSGKSWLSGNWYCLYQQTERVQVRVGEPSIIGVGCGGVPLPPNN